MKLNPFLLLAPMAAGACVTTDPELETGTSEIRNSTQQADPYYRERAAVTLTTQFGIRKPTCTGTRISANYVLTAMHCDPWENQDVGFFSTSANFDTTRDADVAEVIRVAGTNPDDCEGFTNDGCYADGGEGDFADLVLLRIDDGKGDLDAEGPQATLAWRYPGSGVVGMKVGAGNHNGDPNTDGTLRQVADEIYSDDDADGKFDTEDDDTDYGDSGGPFYVNNRIVGVLHGHVDFGLDDYNVYTSVPHHLPWILSRIGFRWRGLTPRTSTKYTGGTEETFATNYLRVCQYACEKTSSCDAYNYKPRVSLFDSGTCELKSDITGATTSSGWSASLKHGNRSGISNPAVGYARSDGYDAVVHRATNGRVHELWQGSQWTASDIHGSAPLVSSGSNVSAYVRADGLNAVVFRSVDQIIQLALTDSGWDVGNLTAVGGAGSTPVGTPVGYVRADGVDAVVYRGSNGDIYELSRGLGGWDNRNLTTNAGSSVFADSDPTAVAGADGVSSIVFRSGTSIYELSRGASGSWWMRSLTSASGGAPSAAGRPFAFRHRNGTRAVVYRSTGNRLVEIWLDGSGWHYQQLSSTAISGDPTAAVRTDGIESITVRSSGDQILEIANAPWGTYNLSNIVGMTGLSDTNTSAYTRADGFYSVVFETADNRVREMSWRPGQPWAWQDLSVVSGETP